MTKISDSIKLYIREEIDKLKEWSNKEFAGKRTEIIVYACVALILTSFIIALAGILTKKFQ